MNFLFNFFLPKYLKITKNKKKLPSTIFIILLFYACMHKTYKHVYANIYIILILLRTSEIIFSI
jgi:hypothetical protein